MSNEEEYDLLWRRENERYITTDTPASSADNGSHAGDGGNRSASIRGA
jgi:hypothetical protein